MTGEVERKIDFEERKSCFKNEVEDFFKNTYKNPNGCEDGIEVCLVRAGYRTVLSAEEKINSQEAEIERYKGVIKILENDVKLAGVKAVKDFAHYLIDRPKGGEIEVVDVADLAVEYMNSLGGKGNEQ